MMINRQVHIFENGIQVFDDQLVSEQRKRDAIRNVHEIEEEEIFVNLIRSMPTDGCFVNIGAAIGYYSLLAKRHSPQLTIHAIEPLEIHRTFFCENIGLNGLRVSDFVHHPFGVSYSDGEATLIEDRFMTSIRGGQASDAQGGRFHQFKSMMKSMLIAAGLRQPKKTISITTHSLDAIMAMIERPVDLCQMDIQGIEFDALKGASKTLADRTIQTFLIGTHGQKLHQNCAALLREHGYLIEVDEPTPKDQPDGILVARFKEV
jgi:FkbM family methyltransferase